MESQEKIKIRVCQGTTCFVMGASRLEGLETQIPPQWRQKVEVSVQPCLGMCQKAGFMKAPFVRIGDEIIGSATVDSVLKKLSEMFK